jgi:uncharacterized hydrophobic protein (TIGR00271 family)
MSESLRVTVEDVARMRDQLLFDGPARRTKLSRFWALLALATVIASAGVVGDSTATVIGAMIVAPLMTPILGSVLSIALGDGRNLARSLGLVATGAASVVGIGYLVGLLVPYAVVASTNSQVAGRIHPRLIDLLAALATGAVGSFALVRSDISDTLPGVAIAISLVPPLAVAGLTLESGAPHQSAGALLLFLTNVAAILLSGLVVMALYRVGRTPGSANVRVVHRRLSVALVVFFTLVIAIPLGAASRSLTDETRDAASVEKVATRWAEPAGWHVDQVDPASTRVVVHASGPLPAPKTARLREELVAAGLGRLTVRLELVPEYTVDLSGK